MKVIKFKVEVESFDEFKALCLEEGVTVKNKLYSLALQDKFPSDILDYFPEDADENLRRLTLKVSNDLNTLVMGKCKDFGFRLRDYVPYLIYKCLLTQEAESMRDE